MKFTIERLALVKMLRHLAGSRKRPARVVRLYACAARVIAETDEVIAGMEALVPQDGSCRVDRVKLLRLLQMYPGKINLSFEADVRGLRFGTTLLPVSSYASAAMPPARFRVFPVTDTWVTGADTPQSSRPGQGQ
jgi:hypothetical protein